MPSLYGFFVSVVCVGAMLITSTLVNVHKTFPHGNNLREESFEALLDSGSGEMTEISVSKMTALATLKPFIYLTQTEECLPSNH